MYIFIFEIVNNNVVRNNVVNTNVNVLYSNINVYKMQEAPAKV